MRLIFIKKHYIKGRKQVVGQKAEVWHSKALDLINKGVAVQYFGKMKDKVKTDFFKPK